MTERGPINQTDSSHIANADHNSHAVNIVTSTSHGLTTPQLIVASIVACAVVYFLMTTRAHGF